MPRPPRLHVKGVLYYASQQGAHDQPLFRSEADTAHYLELLRQYKIKHRFNLFAYSLVPERIGLLIEPLSDTTISEIMRDLSSRYSKYYNSEYGGNGPLFKGRFRTTIAEKESHLGTLVRFLHSQPVMASGGGSAVQASSLNIFAPDNSAQTQHMKDAMRKELEEIEAGSSAESPASFLNPSELEAVESQLSKPFMGSPAFVRRVTEALHENSIPKAELVETAAPAPFVLSSQILSVLLAVSIATGGGVYFVMQKSGWLQKAEQPVSSAVPAMPAETAKPADQTIQASGSAPQVVLDGSSWDVKIIPMAKGEKVTIENDSLIFSGNKVISRSLSEKGFTPTNYNLTVNPDGKITWETMHRSASGEVVSWRGEWHGEEMKGVLSYRMSEGEPKNFNFVGVLKAGGVVKS